MEEAIRDPILPYVGPISGRRFSPGKIVKIQGIVPGTAYRFNIHLQCGSKTVPRDDVAVQISVRVLEGFISLNSLQNGIWDEEQVCATQPIKRAGKFEICLKCNFNQYEVIINGQHFADFPQRIHYDRITHLTIDGDVSITQISYTSDLGNEMGMAGGGDVWVLRTTVPGPTLQVQNETADFEIVNSNGLATPPPSYDVAVQKDDIGSATRTKPSGPPYPTPAPYPATGAYSSTGSPYAPTTTPYPIGPNSAMPAPMNSFNAYPTDDPGTNSTGYYRPPGAAGLPPLPPGAPVPLNAASSNFHPVRRSNTRTCMLIICGIIFGIAFLIIAVIYGIHKRRSSNHNHY